MNAVKQLMYDKFLIILSTWLHPSIKILLIKSVHVGVAIWYQQQPQQVSADGG